MRIQHPLLLMRSQENQRKYYYSDNYKDFVLIEVLACYKWSLFSLPSSPYLAKTRWYILL